MSFDREQLNLLNSLAGQVDTLNAKVEALENFIRIVQTEYAAAQELLRLKGTNDTTGI